MSMLKKVLYDLNPFNRLGKKQYSIFFPLLVSALTALILEVYYNYLLHTPDLVRTPAVLIFLGLIIYFSFHDGIRGGITASTITIVYYFYITFSQYSTNENFINDFKTTIAFGVLYIFLAMVIGGLKQKTDFLIEKEADEKKKLQTILQQIPIGVIVIDKDGKVTHANKQLELISGYKVSIGSILGKDKVLIPETYNVQSSHSPLTQILKSKKTIMKKEYLIKKKDGKEISVQISGSPIWGKNNQIIAVAAVITDITNQKQQEKRKDDFVNIASHELKTPITSLKLYTESLAHKLQTSHDPKSKKILDNIAYQTARLEELVVDLLDVSRLQTGKMKFLKERFRIDRLLADTIEQLQATTKQKIVFDQKPQLTVYADRFRIDQVITNLINNAVKYSPPGKSIIVTLKQDKSHALVSVQDFGIGITKEQQKKIFDRLYQVSESKENTFPGLGIGLYIAKQIIKRHRGLIWVKSEKGKGSTFSFKISLSH